MGEASLDNLNRYSSINILYDVNNMTTFHKIYSVAIDLPHIFLENRVNYLHIDVNTKLKKLAVKTLMNTI